VKKSASVPVEKSGEEVSRFPVIGQGSKNKKIGNKRFCSIAGV